MELKEIGRFDYKDYKIIILESIDEDDGYCHYWITLKGYGKIESVYGVNQRQTADFVWLYVQNYIDELIDDFNGEL